ncbi:MAG TPA: hypothetical protein VJ695_07990 [Nitrososphaera sp.]|nr:hypothetical protein [Nitrososphaera sp.]
MHPGLFIVVAVIALLFLSLVTPISMNVPAYAHFEHFTHYNNRGSELGEYYAYEALEPEYARPNEPVAVMFSIQDSDGRDIYNINTMVEIYSATTGERLEAWPWTRQDIGDFEVFYNFPELGNYQIVLSVAQDGPLSGQYGIDPPRTTLSSNANCDCQRAIFNVSITDNFGTIWIVTMALSVSLPLSLIGGVLIWNYRRIKKSGRYGGSMRTDTVRYIIMLAAIAGGVVHLVVYAEHASLRLEYSIFLLVAAGMQIVYGVVYTLMALSGYSAMSSGYHYYYRKKIAVNLFGLVGTGILLGLYAYSVILPPPLSPSGQPQSIEVSGILAKAIEVFTVIGIIYLMRLEKDQLKVHQLKEQTK